ncbi:MAG: transketolase C-terminal domain-containing protein, partial [bacterium]
ATLTKGQARVLREGWEVQLWALGDMIPAAIETADILAAKGISAGVVNGRFINPIDSDLLGSQARLARVFATMENGVASGGFGTAVEEYLVEQRYQGHIIRLGWPREFVPHGATPILLARYGLTPEAMAERVIATLSG